MKLHIVGDWLYSGTGYSAHSKGLISALYKLHSNISYDCPKPPDWVRYVNDNELKMLNTPYTDDRTVICITQPIYSKIYIADNPSKFYQYVIWEGDSCPQYWIKHLANNKINGVLCPSLHTKQSILNTINLLKKQRKRGVKEVLKGVSDVDLENLEKKIFIVPHGFSPKIFYPLKTKK